MEIKCPECGGNIIYWKEYLVTKTQTISESGALSHEVKESKQEEISDMEGFECKKCGWFFNTVNDVMQCEKHGYLMEWMEAHEKEIKV